MNEMSPVEQVEFASNVQALAENGTLWKLLSMIEDEQVAKWQIAIVKEDREQCWHVLQGIQELSNKIRSFREQDKYREWYNKKISRRI